MNYYKKAHHIVNSLCVCMMTVKALFNHIFWSNPLLSSWSRQYSTEIG